MGFFGLQNNRVQDFHKWDFINLNDFHSSSCGKGLSYAWLWFLALVAVAVYAADTFTAVQLLVFNRWSGQVQPAIPFDISKWIFAGCICFSWLLCAFEWARAIITMKKNSISADYLDPLAVTLQSIKNSQGYRKFLVFAALTKSKRGNDYIALFAYFQFKGFLRIALAEGPRQVINAMTLYSVMQARIIPHNTSGGLELWFQNVKALADQEVQQAVILFSMLFTFIIWLFSALSLIIAGILYITFLWHFIPREDGLSDYCRRKIEKRLERAVAAKYKKAMDKQEAKRIKAEVETMKRHGPSSISSGTSSHKPPSPFERNTSPSSGSFPSPTLSRQTTQSTLSLYTDHKHEASSLSRKPTLPNLDSQSSRPTLARQPTLPNMAQSALSDNESQARQPRLPNILGEQRPQMYRTLTTASNMSTISVDSNKPLLDNAAGMGGNPPPLVRSTTQGSGTTNILGRPPPQRTITGNSLGDQLYNGGASRREPTPTNHMATYSGDDRPITFYAQAMRPLKPASPVGTFSESYEMTSQRTVVPSSSSHFRFTPEPLRSPCPQPAYTPATYQSLTPAPEQHYSRDRAAPLHQVPSWRAGSAPPQQMRPPPRVATAPPQQMNPQFVANTMSRGRMGPERAGTAPPRHAQAQEVDRQHVRDWNDVPQDWGRAITRPGTAGPEYGPRLQTAAFHGSRVPSQQRYY